MPLYTKFTTLFCCVLACMSLENRGFFLTNSLFLAHPPRPPLFSLRRLLLLATAEPRVLGFVCHQLARLFVYIVTYEQSVAIRRDHFSSPSRFVFRRTPAGHFLHSPRVGPSSGSQHRAPFFGEMYHFIFLIYFLFHRAETANVCRCICFASAVVRVCSYVPACHIADDSCRCRFWRAQCNFCF